MASDYQTSIGTMSCAASTKISITGPKWLLSNVKGSTFTLPETDADGLKRSTYIFREYDGIQGSDQVMTEVSLKAGVPYTAYASAKSIKCAWNGSNVIVAPQSVPVYLSGNGDSFHAFHGSMSSSGPDQYVISYDQLNFIYDRPGARVDDTPPIIVAPDETITLSQAKTWTPLHGVTADDDVDGDLTSKVTSNPDTRPVEMTTTPGKYKFVYSVQDTAGNKSAVFRFITVLSDPLTRMPASGGSDIPIALVGSTVVVLLGLLTVWVRRRMTD